MAVNTEETLSFALHNSSYLVKAAMKAAFVRAGHNVTPEEFVALYLIPEDGLEQGELVAKSLKDKTNITRLVGRMVEKGWIKQVVHPQSRRQQIVKLTRKGKTLKGKLIRIGQQVTDTATRGISQRDIDNARKTLKRLTANLTD